MNTSLRIEKIIERLEAQLKQGEITPPQHDLAVAILYDDEKLFDQAQEALFAHPVHRVQKDFQQVYHDALAYALWPGRETFAARLLSEIKSEPLLRFDFMEAFAKGDRRVLNMLVPHMKELGMVLPPHVWDKMPPEWLLENSSQAAQKERQLMWQQFVSVLKPDVRENHAEPASPLLHALEHLPDPYVQIVLEHWKGRPLDWLRGAYASVLLDRQHFMEPLLNRGATATNEEKVMLFRGAYRQPHLASFARRLYTTAGPDMHEQFMDVLEDDSTGPGMALRTLSGLHHLALQCPYLCTDLWRRPRLRDSMIEVILKSGPEANQPVVQMLEVFKKQGCEIDLARLDEKMAEGSPKLFRSDRKEQIEQALQSSSASRRLKSKGVRWGRRAQ